MVCRSVPCLLPSTEGWHSSETVVRVNILRRVSLKIMYYLQIMYLFNNYLLDTCCVPNIISNEEDYQLVRYWSSYDVKRVLGKVIRHKLGVGMEGSKG